MKSRTRIKGNARGLMMICRDIRRRWLQYGENRSVMRSVYSEKRPLFFICGQCEKDLCPKDYQIDHIKPLGSRPRKWEDLGEYAKKMFERKCQALCKKCHKEKTDAERKRRTTSSADFDKTKVLRRQSK